MKRKFYRVDFSSLEYVNNDSESRTECAESEANAVSSRLQGTIGNLHAPVLDIDYGARLIPSSTPGHSHLYLDVTVTWDEYVEVLEALAKCGLIEEGYKNAAIARGATFVRTPGTKK